MKKSLIALAALSAFATTAQAQSSVTVYGLYDAGFSTSKTDYVDTGAAALSSRTGTQADVKNSGFNAVGSPTASSRLGFRGTEDLGGGLRANFNLEYAFDGNGALTINNATPNSGVRTATVGLSDSKLGTFNVGRQLTGVHGTVAGFNPLAGNNMVGDMLYSSAFRAHATSNTLANGYTTSGVDAAAGTNAILGTATTADPAIGDDSRDSVRMSNGISYVSPTFSGFSARIDYAQDKRNANAATSAPEVSVKHQGLTANYTGGPVRVAASTHTAKTDTEAAGAGTTEAKFNAVSGEYRLNQALALQASYATAEWTTAGAVTNETKGYRLGASYGVGKWVLAAQYGQGDVKTPIADNATNTDAGRPTAADRTAYQLAAFYNLSKRTALYAAYGFQEQKVTAATAETDSGDLPADRAKSVGDKRKDTQMAVGIRHSF